MPNNSSARREKVKKKQDKKRGQFPPFCTRRIKPARIKLARMAALSLSLSLFDAGEDEANKERNSLSLSSDRKETAPDLSDPKFLERVLLMEFRSGLTQEERLAKRQRLRSEIRNANPGILEEDLRVMLNDAMVRVALEARKRKSQSTKDSSLSLLPLGNVKNATSLSSSAEPKMDSPLHWKNSLSLTGEERATVRAETRAANPGADEKEFALKYKLDLWAVDVKKRAANKEPP
jgi:hypothetical protein